MAKLKAGDKVVVEGFDSVGRLLDGMEGKVIKYTSPTTVKLMIKHEPRQRVAEVAADQCRKVSTKRSRRAA